MKKTFISVLILTALFTTGCQDKEAQAKIEQLNQTVAQLSTENTQLKNELNAEKTRAASIIPAIFTEEDKVFEKSETIKYPKSKDEFTPKESSIIYSISTLKTNIDWLNGVLWQELTRDVEKNTVPTREQLIAEQQKSYDEARKEMAEEAISGIEESRWVEFIGQREKLATFAIVSYSYAYGVGENRYFTVDLASHHILTLDDLFDKKSLPEVKALLWNRYTEDGSIKDDETFTTKADFYVSDNIYLDIDGVHFIYGVYAIQPYAGGEQDLTLGWWELEKLLKPEFKQKNYVKISALTE